MLNDLSYGIKIWTDLYSVLSQCTRLTDRHTDSFLIARPRLQHSRFSKFFSLTLVCRFQVQVQDTCGYIHILDLA